MVAIRYTSIICVATLQYLLYIIVCRDLEFRVNNKSINDHGGLVEVCIDDQWHEATSAKVANTQSLQDISVMTADLTSESVMLEWSGQPNNKIISGYDLSCTTSSLSDHGQIHEVRVSNISISTTEVQISGLLPGTAYQCCINAHIQTNTPLDLISSNCVNVSTKTVTVADTVTEIIISTKAAHVTSFIDLEGEFTSTRNEFASSHHDCSCAGLGIGLGVA
ncbi:MAG: fibronectin type III domain-containing protein, partial [Proteobacteria bacterium]|nr:fibronectin type III domain-containing protein [Pseudomonadota bacterium]